MLGLRQEIGGDKARVGARIGQDHDLGRTGDHVDADDAENAPLGRGDEGVAGPDDLADGRDRLRAVGERGDRLGAADAIDLVDAGDARRGQDERIDPAVRRRHDHGEAAATRDFRRHGVHDDRRGIARGPARDVEADRFDRPPAPPELDPERIGEAHVGRLLPPVIVHHPLVGELERPQRLRLRRRDRRFDLGRSDGDALGLDIDPVEPERIIGQRLVAALAHVLDDGGDRGVDIRRLLALAGEERLEAPLEVARSHVELNGHQMSPSEPSGERSVGQRMSGAGLGGLPESHVAELRLDAFDL